MTSHLIGQRLHIELLNPQQLFEVHAGSLATCVDPNCDGTMAGEIHGEFWLNTALYRQWMNCTCSTCGRKSQEVLELYEVQTQQYIVQDFITIYDDRFDITYRWPGFTQSIAPLIQAAQKDGDPPGLLIQQIINHMLQISRRQHLERSQCSL